MHQTLPKYIPHMHILKAFYHCRCMIFFFCIFLLKKEQQIYVLIISSTERTLAYKNAQQYNILLWLDALSKFRERNV